MINTVWKHVTRLLTHLALRALRINTGWIIPQVGQLLHLLIVAFTTFTCLFDISHRSTRDAWSLFTVFTGQQQLKNPKEVSLSQNQDYIQWVFSAWHKKERNWPICVDIMDVKILHQHNLYSRLTFYSKYSVWAEVTISKSSYQSLLNQFLRDPEVSGHVLLDSGDSFSV